MREPDFSGWASKVGLKCSDGRTIMADAFKAQTGQTVPLVWQHGRAEPKNVLGHAVLENRPEGVYAYGFFNDTQTGKNAKELVKHGDVDSLSIWANNLVERAKEVFHGKIHEVSLVLQGANPGAKIENVNIAHGDGFDEVLDDEAVIYTGLALEHEDLPETLIAHADDEDEDDDEDDAEGEESEQSVADVLATLNETQAEVVNALLAEAISVGAEASHSDEDDEDELDDEDDNEENLEHSDEDSDETNNEDNLTHQEGTGEMSRNVFESSAAIDGQESGPVLTHSQIQTIFSDAKKQGSLKEAILTHAEEYGITNIDLLFPDAQKVRNTPDWVKRRQEWVAGVISGTHHTPFSRIKSLSADITHDDARAKGYIKGTMKKDEFFALAQRVTTPKTIYKKQKLDRDDILDITDFDVVSWIRGEMRMMLEEEIARAILIGDGREPEDPDKINETNLRPVAKDHSFYAHQVNYAAGTTGEALIEAIMRDRKHYKGLGNPTFFTTEDVLTDLLLIKDRIGRRIYDSVAAVEAALRVNKIVTVEVMESDPTLVGILLNLSDYTVGADKGGAITTFDDFDIDFNQYKYLIETRISGALTKPKSALVVRRVTGTPVTPDAPDFDPDTGVLTVPSVANVTYFLETIEGDEELDSGAQDPISISETVTVVAVPDEGYYFPSGAQNSWTFTRVS